ncbi:MAG: hypothetical protein WCF65_07970, partial [Parachlamydiaceae bacterium]
MPIPESTDPQHIPHDVMESIVYNKIQADRAAGKKIWLVFGLSANPIHLGHVHYLDLFTRYLNPDRVIVIPNKFNPQKNPQNQCSIAQKIKTCQAAIAGHKNWELDRRELEREGPSYSWKTVEELTGEAGSAARIYFLLTDETAESLPTWVFPPAITEKETPEEYESRRNFIPDRVTIVYGGRSEVDSAANGLLPVKLLKLDVKPADKKLYEALKMGYIPIHGTLA